MESNPFRRIPSTNVDDWGKTKFKPNNFGNGKSNFQKRDHKTFNRKGSNFHKNKETYKFNEVSNDAKPDNATPWEKYKNEIVYKQREEEQAALQASMNSSEAKMMLKQREINYRRSLIQQKKQEPTEWEDFAEEDGSDKNDTKSKKCAKYESGKPNIHKVHKQNENKKRNNTNDKFNKHPKTKFKKNVPSSELTSHAQEFISKELLRNFDSKKLNYQQNDKLRGTITKTTIMAHGTSLEDVVKDMKMKAKKKGKLNLKNIQ